MEDRKRHYQDVDGKSRRDSTGSDGGRSRGSATQQPDRRGGADYRRDRKRDRSSGKRCKRSSYRESAAEPSAPPEPLGDVKLGGCPKPPKEINLAHSSTESSTAAASGYSSHDDESSVTS